jgi:pheromone shutdown protein TraB
MSNQKSDNFLENNDSSSKEISENIDTKEIKNTETLTILDGPQNSKVYLVGTAHFSRESQNEVVELIKKVRPNRVVLELCNSRINILKLDEESVLKEAKEMNISKMIQLIKQVYTAF